MPLPMPPSCLWVGIRASGGAGFCEKNEERNRPGHDGGGARRPPIAGIPASIIGSVEPKLAAPELVVPLRPRQQPTSGGVEREWPATRQEASMDGDSPNRNRDLVAGDRRHGFQKELRTGGAGSRGKVSSVATESGGNERRARRNEHPTLNTTPGDGGQTIDSKRHARGEVEAQIKCNDRVRNNDYDRDN